MQFETFWHGRPGLSLQRTWIPHQTMEWVRRAMLGRGEEEHAPLARRGGWVRMVRINHDDGVLLASLRASIEERWRLISFVLSHEIAVRGNIAVSHLQLVPAKKRSRVWQDGHQQTERQQARWGMRGPPHGGPAHRHHQWATLSLFSFPECLIPVALRE